MGDLAHAQPAVSPLFRPPATPVPESGSPAQTAPSSGQALAMGAQAGATAEGAAAVMGHWAVDGPPNGALAGLTGARTAAGSSGTAAPTEGAATAATAPGPTDAQVATAVEWGHNPKYAPGAETLAAIQAALGVPKSAGYDAATARAVYAKQQALNDKNPDGKAGPQFCGQLHISFAHVQGKAPSPKGDDGNLHLRTALDAKVTTTKVGTGYLIALHLDPQAKPIVLGNFEALGKPDGLRQLPIYIEDFVTADHALVKIRYNPKLVKLNLGVVEADQDGHKIKVEATEVAEDQLLAAAGPRAKDVGPGYIADGAETVASHLGGSEIDKVMASVASAEGGFASTEGSDLGIFTWGQGQWTVGANLLQPVMQFIKDHRPDLYERYWGAAGLDVRGSVLYYQGQPYAGEKKLTELFRGSKDKNLAWVNLFAQAGQDPQIQRLQREYQRGEVREKLAEPVDGTGGKAPDAWLDTRGKAFYYSMWVNLPGAAHTFFQEALSAAGKATEPTDALRAAVSTSMENGFKNSGVTARDGSKHHFIAFWGERGRQKALAECDQHIANPALDKKWNTEQWKKHRADMAKRPSRYENTKKDIDRALAKQDVEPDLPSDVSFGDQQSVGPSAPDGGAATQQPAAGQDATVNKGTGDEGAIPTSGAVKPPSAPDHKPLD